MFAGDGGAGKTDAALQLAANIARRAPDWFGHEIMPGPVVFVSAAELREALADVKRLGFPVLIKAAAGGGGKGMRVARDEKELTRLFALARAESEAALARARCTWKNISSTRGTSNPDPFRHLSKPIHLGERDCTIQRRHQKLLERRRARL